MAAEYTYNAEQNILLNQAILMNTSIPCKKGNIVHEDGSGIFILRGITNQCYAVYQVTYNGNISLPTGATVTPIAVAIIVNGEIRPTSTAVFTPAAVDEYGNVTSTAIIRVPRGCCFTLSIDNVPATNDPTVTPAPVIQVENSNLVVNRIA